jgi:hypothetical protein
MQLTVELGVNSDTAFDIDLFDNVFVSKWVKELEWHLDNCAFDQQEAFASFLSLDQAEQILISSCETINRYLKNFIDIKSNISQQPQQYFNYLHHIFERLSGSFGAPTRLFAIAPPDLKQAIRQLNFYVHRVESQKPAFENLYISFDKDKYRRQPLAESDYEYFEFEIAPGTLVLHYAELGKNFTDLYQDGLSLDYGGFKNLHYYSGEASLMLHSANVFQDTGLSQWLQSQGIDPYNKRHGHGIIPLGSVVDVDSVAAKLSQHRFIHKILIKEISLSAVQTGTGYIAL